MNREEARSEALKSHWVRSVFALSIVWLVLSLVSLLHRQVVHAHGSSFPLAGRQHGTLHGPYELEPGRFEVTFSSTREKPSSGSVLVVSATKTADSDLDLASAPRVLEEEATVSESDHVSYSFSVTEAGEHYVLMKIPYWGGWSANKVRMVRLLWPHPAYFLLAFAFFLLLGLGLIRAQVKLLTGEAF